MKLLPIVRTHNVLFLRPSAFELPRRMKHRSTSYECGATASRKTVIEPQPNCVDTYTIRYSFGLESHLRAQLGADPGDVVGPEDAAEFGEVAFVEVGVAGGGLQGLVADLYVERVGFGVDDDVRAVDGEFLVDAVADGGGEAEHRRNCRRAEQDGDAREQLAAALAEEGFEEEAEEHLRRPRGL